ncbi:unnamed protein product [Penicillium salamii]|uniref:Uncharacterized protein n=1 Tax=Penicillium salamii TaxID=1612424 RepID=A0A9W4NRM3_9EURO|nr:unnamed protein product [Penicillium salamii]CAG8287918.1 unnamed protein product [Penicillium salamii]CAG8357290.1 unnamed protein product [Penicillium salamii]CAG8402474.1 unnamed protein product [Penicillium salamii]
MFPPCDPSILEHNPQFKRLYESLTTSLLTSDASTRTQPRSSAPAVVEQCQTQHAKKRVKEQLLEEIAFVPDTALSADVRNPASQMNTLSDISQHHDNLAIITLFLSSPPGALTLGQDNDTLSLLSPDIQTFTSNLPTLVQPLSSLLSKSIYDLRALSTQQQAPEPELPSHHARARARDRRARTSMAPIPLLSDELSSRVRNLRQAQLVEVPAARRKMAVTAAEVIALQTHILERTVVILERAKYGALARATRAKADHLAIVAQGVEGKLEVTKLEIGAMIYSPETVAALSRYKMHLVETAERLEELRKAATADLKALGDPDLCGLDGGALDDIKSRYGTLAREVELVKAEIAQLRE